MQIHNKTKTRHLSSQPTEVSYAHTPRNHTQLIIKRTNLGLINWNSHLSLAGKRFYEQPTFSLDINFLKTKLSLYTLYSLIKRHLTLICLPLPDTQFTSLMHIDAVLSA